MNEYGLMFIIAGAFLLLLVVLNVLLTKKKKAKKGKQTGREKSLEKIAEIKGGR